MGIKKSAHALWEYINYRHPRILGINVRSIIQKIFFLKKDFHYAKRFRWGGQI